MLRKPHLREIPGTLLAKHFNPSYTIGAGCLVWSIAASCQATAVNRAGIFVSRLFLGIGEASTATAIIFYLSIWYTKRDIAKRVSLFVAGGTISGAFSGLISYGIARIHHPSIAPWRILFLIEGLPGIFLALAILLFMPSRPETSRLLTAEQRSLCLERIRARQAVDSALGLSLPGLRRGLSDWKTYVIAVA